MTIYLDASALVKLVVVEQESDALRQYLGARRTQIWASSALVRVEVVRAVRRVDPNLTPGAVAACRRANIIPVSPDLLAEASKLDPRDLRSLDAIHLASALRLANAGLDAFVGYDQRLLQAASDAGLPTASPGS